MNTNNNNSAETLQCCVDYCETTFESNEGTVTNAYACNQRSFTSSDMWKIQQVKKHPELSKHSLPE